MTAVNDAPVAADDSATTNEDAPVTVDLLANDSDTDGALDPNTVVVTTSPAHGSVVVDPLTGQATYTPDPNYNGPDTFTYQVCDTDGSCVSAAVTIDVAPVNDAPTAADDTATTGEETPVAIDVLVNDVDADGALDPASVTVTVAPAHGTTSVDPATGVITYTPDPSYNGPDTLTYQVCDDGTPALCASATVTIDVTGVNDAPVAIDDLADHHRGDAGRSSTSPPTTSTRTAISTRRPSPSGSPLCTESWPSIRRPAPSPTPPTRISPGRTASPTRSAIWATPRCAPPPPSP